MDTKHSNYHNKPSGFRNPSDINIPNNYRNAVGLKGHIVLSDPYSVKLLKSFWYSWGVGRYSDRVHN
jgi:hypothetical protein